MVEKLKGDLWVFKLNVTVKRSILWLHVIILNTYDFTKSSLYINSSFLIVNKPVLESSVDFH